MKPPNAPTDTSVQSRKNEALAKRKRTTIKRLLREICELTGKSRIKMDFAIVGPAPTQADAGPSHVPSRHPESPLPPPKPGRRQLLGHPHTALSFELERRELAARKWSESAGHEFQLAKHVDLKIVHHSGCNVHMNSKDCSCDPLFLVRSDGKAFAVDADGSLEPFREPEPSVEAFMDDWLRFFVDGAWHVEEWAKPAINPPILEFTSIADADGTEHFLDLPSEYQAPKPSADHE